MDQGNKIVKKIHGAGWVAVAALSILSGLGLVARRKKA